MLAYTFVEQGRFELREKPRPEYDLADWVLSRLTQAEKKAVEARYDDICGALELMMKGQFDTAMSRYNG